MRGSCPNTDEIRAALEHMAASEAFRGSPQLVAFLRYVVEETLRGASDRIKGYTIAVEALGRAENFDPQVDPIVRVEAMRLRRALARYYANGGKNDPVLIDLPLGSYVPAFRRAEPPQLAPALRSAPSRRPGAAKSALGRSALARIGLARLAAGLAFVLVGAAIYAGLDFWFDFPRRATRRAFARAPRAGVARSAGLSGGLRRPDPAARQRRRGAGGRHVARQAARRARAFRRDPGRGRSAARQLGRRAPAGARKCRPQAATT